MMSLALATIVVYGGLGFGVPGQASAAPIICGPQDTDFDFIVPVTNALQVDSGDSHIYVAPSTATLRITENFTATANTNASKSTTSGTDISINAAVAGFNVAAGFSSGSTNAMESSRSDSKTVS